MPSTSEGEDHRQLPLSLGKANLAWLLKRCVKGTFIADYEQREIGPHLFRAACTMVLEGTSRGVRADGAGRCWHSIEAGIRARPAYTRVRENILR